MDWRLIAAQVGDKRPPKPDRGRMRQHLAWSCSLLLLLAPLLAGCLERGETAMPSALAEDDDTFCRAGGKVMPGSPDYVYCRRDRDAQRNATLADADRRQRDLGEYMLNHPN
jgi:hypothetical protein